MAFKKIQIRDAIATAVTGLATTGANVYRRRSYPIQAGQLPALTIRIGETEQEISHMEAGAGVYSVENKTEIIVRAHAATTTTTGAPGQTAAEDIEAVIGQIELEVLEALGGSNDLADLVTALYPAGIGEVETDGEGEQEIGSIDLFFIAHWFAPVNDWE